MTTKSKKYSPEVRERAARMVFEHRGEHASQWAAIESIAAKIGCTAETLRSWVRRQERDSGQREGLTSADKEELGSDSNFYSVAGTNQAAPALFKHRIAL